MKDRNNNTTTGVVVNTMPIWDSMGYLPMKHTQTAGSIIRQVYYTTDALRVILMCCDVPIANPFEEGQNDKHAQLVSGRRVFLCLSHHRTSGIQTLELSTVR